MENYVLSTDTAGTWDQAINRALATGRKVQLRDNKTYVICNPVFINSGQELAGGSNSVIQACSFWKTKFNTCVDPSNVACTPANNAFISNANWAASTLTDHDIAIHDITFDATLFTTFGNDHAIGMRYAQHVDIYNVRCVSAADCTAMQADKDYTVRNNYATTCANVCFDNWEGPQNAQVVDNIAYCAAVGVNGSPSGGVGVMFTAAGIGAADNTNGSNVFSSRNRVYCGGGIVGITANVLSANSSMKNVRSVDDFVDDQSTSAGGILFKGALTGGLISHPTVVNTNGGSVVSVTTETYNSTVYSPSYFTIDGVNLVNPVTASGPVASIVALGAYHNIVNSTVRNTSGIPASATFPSPLWVNDPTTTVSGCFDTGSTAGITVSGTSPQINNTCPGTLRAFAYNLFTNLQDVTVNSTTATSMLNTGTGLGNYTIPANGTPVGRTYTVVFRGVYTTPAGNTSTMTLSFKAGSVAVVSATTAALPSSVSGLSFNASMDCTQRSVGTSGLMVCYGRVDFNSGSGLVSYDFTGTGNYDTTVSEALTAYARWSAVTTQTATIKAAYIDVKT